MKKIRMKIQALRREYSTNALLYLCAIAFFYIAQGAFSMLQGLYIKEIGAQESFLGLVLSSKTAVSALFSVPAAMLVGRFGKKKGILITMIFVPLTSMLQAMVVNQNLLLALSIIQGLTQSFILVSEGPFFMENSKGSHRLKLFSYSFATNVFSNMLGYFSFGVLDKYLGSYMISVQSLRYSMIISSIIGLISCAFIIFIKENKIDQVQSNKEVIKDMAVLIKDSNVHNFLIYNAIIGFGAGLVVPYFNVYLKYKVNASTDAIGVIMSTAQFAMGFGGLLTPLIAKRLGRVKTINLCQLASIPFLMLVALPPNIFIVGFALFMRNGLMNMAGPVVNTMTMEMIPKESRSIFSSMNNIAANLSRAISTYVGGYIMGHFAFGYEIPYFLTAVLYFAATMLFYKCFGSYEKQKENSTVLA